MVEWRKIHVANSKNVHKGIVIDMSQIDPKWGKLQLITWVGWFMVVMKFESVYMHLEPNKSLTKLPILSV